MLIILISFEYTLGMTEAHHRQIENDHIDDLFTNFALILDVENSENWLIELLVTGSAHIDGTSIKFDKVDLLVGLFSKSIYVFEYQVTPKAFNGTEFYKCFKINGRVFGIPWFKAVINLK